jgi:hypothetical protein
VSYRRGGAEIGGGGGGGAASDGADEEAMDAAATTLQQCVIPLVDDIYARGDDPLVECGGCYSQQFSEPLLT